MDKFSLSRARKVNAAVLNPAKTIKADPPVKEIAQVAKVTR